MEASSVNSRLSNDAVPRRYIRVGLGERCGDRLAAERLQIRQGLPALGLDTDIKRRSRRCILSFLTRPAVTPVARRGRVVGGH